MKLYYSPGACSIGIRVLLEEIGKPYQQHKLDFQKQEQYAPQFTTINPKSKVPTIVTDDGSVLTEFPAIAIWLARMNPDKHLLPQDAVAEARALETMDYVVSTLHMQGFTRMFRPGNFAPSETDHDKVKTRAREIIERGFELLNRELHGKSFVVDKFSVADAALFYVELWASRTKTVLPEGCASHYERMKSRPSVSRALAAENLTAP